MAPTLFILVAEVLNLMLRKAEAGGSIAGIKLPNSNQSQLISQFADDTSILLEVSRPETTLNLINILTTFKSASGLEINWAKSSAYWCCDIDKPPWLEDVGWSWAREKDLSKLLGTSFGVDLDTGDIGSFLINRIKSKLEYWTNTKLPLAGRALIIKQVLLLSMWFFLSVWNGSVKALVKAKVLLRNYLWSGIEHSSRTRVNWNDCCAKKKVGGLGLLDRQEATASLLCKWIMLAYLPGHSNLQIMLRNKLWYSNPAKGTRWPMSPQWGLVSNHTSVPGSKVWSKLHLAWKKMNAHLCEAPPLNYAECNPDATLVGH